MYWLVFMSRLTLYIFLISQRWQHFLKPLLVFSNSYILIVLTIIYPFPSLNSSTNWSDIWKSWSNVYQKIIFSDKITILLSFFTHFDFVPVLSHYIPMIQSYYFLPALMFFLRSLQMISICDRWQYFLYLGLMTWLPHIIHTSNWWDIVG